MSLKNLLTQIQEQTILANQDVEGGNPQTVNSRRGIKRQAQEQLIGLKEDYFKAMLQTSTFILVSGEGKDSFASIAASDFNCFSADPEALYKVLADKIDPQLYLNRSTADALDVATRHLEDLASDLGIVEFSMIQWKQAYARILTSKEDLVALIKQAINEQVGSELVGIYTVKSLVDTAIAANHSSQVTPIVLPTNDDGLIAELKGGLEAFGTKSFAITAGKTKGKRSTIHLAKITEETVREALSEVRGAL